MYNKYTIEHQDTLFGIVSDLKHAWADIRSEAFMANTIEELESLLIEAPLYDAWLSLIKRNPLISFESMWEIASALGKEVDRIAEELLQFC